MTFRRKYYKWTADRYWYQINLWKEITFPWKTTPNKVSFSHCHWTVRTILPLRHISVQGLTALLRRTWNYSGHLAEQQVTPHSHHTYGKPCPHALENGALKSPHPFKVSSSSPDEQHPPPLHSGLHIFARNIHWHWFQPEMPWPMRLLTAVPLFWYTLCLPMEACRQQKKKNKPKNELKQQQNHSEKAM